MRSYKGSLFKFIKAIVTMFILGVITYFLLSGIVNQAKTGESLANWATRGGKRISEVLYSIKEGNGPVKLNKNGVYLKNANVPSSSAVKPTTPAKVDMAK